METESGFKLGEIICRIYIEEKLAENLLAGSDALGKLQFSRC